MSLHFRRLKKSATLSRSRLEPVGIVRAPRQQEATQAGVRCNRKGSAMACRQRAAALLLLLLQVGAVPTTGAQKESKSTDKIMFVTEVSGCPCPEGTCASEAASALYNDGHAPLVTNDK